MIHVLDFWWLRSAQGSAGLCDAKSFGMSAYALNETGGQRNDQVSTRHLSEVGGTVGAAAGKFGNAASFSTGILTSAAAITGVSLYRGWFRYPTGGGGTVFTNGRLSSQHVTLSAGGAGTVLTWAHASGGGGMSLAAVTPDVWHLFHIWLSTGPNTINIALDAGAVSSSATTHPVPSQPLTIGGSWNGSVVSNQFAGQVDDFVMLGSGRFLDTAERTADFASVAFENWCGSPSTFGVAALDSYTPNQILSSAIAGA